MRLRISSANRAGRLRIGQVMFQDRNTKYVISAKDHRYFVLENLRDSESVKILPLQSLLREG
ncbi:MAG TPA: hypothetical protein VKR32_15910 [Puia sp.]|nr:hypothetical protein [Puia sp.]